ncbi:MAG: acyl-CoA dehydrogenase family protein [Thermocrispum sp.]
MNGRTPELDDLARAVRSVLDREPDECWPVLCEQVGVAGLGVPERFGGLGAGVAELQVVAEELGLGLTASPLLGSSVLATVAVLSTGEDATCARLLPTLADGSRRAALAWASPDGWDHPAFRATDGRLDGTAAYVLDGAGADVLLAVGWLDGEPALFEVDTAVPPVESMDQSLRLATVRLDRAPARLLGRPDLGAVRDAGLAVLAAEQVSAAAEALARTVAYTREREQFGRPVGSFQALKHRMADLHVLVESARSAAYAAGAALAANDPDASRAALTAKVTCSAAFSTVAAEMIQLHGGIGFTWEHDAHRYFKRAHATAELLGSPREHLARLATQL